MTLKKALLDADVRLGLNSLYLASSVLLECIHETDPFYREAARIQIQQIRNEADWLEERIQEAEAGTK